VVVLQQSAERLHKLEDALGLGLPTMLVEMYIDRAWPYFPKIGNQPSHTVLVTVE